MANPACQNDDGNQAVFIGTFLESGLAVTICRDCLQAFATALTQDLTGVPVIELLANYEGTLMTNEATIELTDEEKQQAAWLEDHREAIQAVQDQGATFEEAIAAVMEVEAESVDSTNDATTDDN